MSRRVGAKPGALAESATIDCTNRSPPIRRTVIPGRRVSAGPGIQGHGGG